MPSGAKKRKAAKKKKENQYINHASPSTHSHDDVKHQDDKDSDASEVSSPASRDHHSHLNIITEGDQEEPNFKDIVVQIERESKFEDESIEKDGKTEHDEPARKSYDGSSSGSSSISSSSSLDDESHGITSSPAVVDIDPVVNSVTTPDLLFETPAEPIGTAIIEEANVVVETPVVDEITSLVEKVEENEKVEKNGCSIGDKVEISADFMDAASETKESTFIQSVENTAQIPDQKECVIQENDERFVPSYIAQSVPVNNGVESVKDSLTQPLLEPPVQRTSWRSCCGLCELFTGSAR